MNITLLSSSTWLLIWLRIVLIYASLGLNQHNLRRILSAFALCLTILDHGIHVNIEFSDLFLGEVCSLTIVFINFLGIKGFRLPRNLRLISYLILNLDLLFFSSYLFFDEFIIKGIVF